MSFGKWLKKSLVVAASLSMSINLVNADPIPLSIICLSSAAQNEKLSGTSEYKYKCDVTECVCNDEEMGCRPEVLYEVTDKSGQKVTMCLTHLLDLKVYPAIKERLEFDSFLLNLFVGGSVISSLKNVLIKKLNGEQLTEDENNKMMHAVKSGIIPELRSVRYDDAEKMHGEGTCCPICLTSILEICLGKRSKSHESDLCACPGCHQWICRTCVKKLEEGKNVCSVCKRSWHGENVSLQKGEPAIRCYYMLLEKIVDFLDKDYKEDAKPLIKATKMCLDSYKRK